MTVSSQELREAFLSPQMLCYFERKLPDVPAHEVRVRVEETLRFLNIATYCSGRIPVSKEIDDIWHYWILETREYETLCASLQGQRFIHHSSNVYASCGEQDAAGVGSELKQDVAMLATYVRNYGPFAAERIKYWPLAEHLVENCDLGIDDLNAWLMSSGSDKGRNERATVRISQT